MIAGTPIGINIRLMGSNGNITMKANSTDSTTPDAPIVAYDGLSLCRSKDGTDDANNPIKYKIKK